MSDGPSSGNRRFSFEDYVNKFIKSCAECKLQSDLCNSHPLCGAHSPCRSGVNMWTPERCQACKNICYTILNNSSKSLVVKQNMFSTLMQILYNIKNLEAFPLNWEYKSGIFLKLQEICTTNEVFPDLIAQINTLLDQDTIGSHIDPIESPVDPNESPIPGTSYFIDDGTQPIISIKDPQSHFPDYDWLPLSGGKLEPSTGFVWIKIDFNFCIKGNSMTERSSPNKKFEIEMHPDLEHFRILSESKSHQDDEDQHAILLTKEAHSYVASYVDSWNIGNSKRFPGMYPKQRNIQIKNMDNLSFNFSKILINHLLSQKSLEGQKIPLKDFPDNSDAFSFDIPWPEQLVHSQEPMNEIFHEDNLDYSSMARKLMLSNLPSIDSKSLTEEREARLRFATALSSFCGLEIVIDLEQLSTTLNNHLQAILRNLLPSLFYLGQNWVQKKLDIRKKFFGSCDPSVFSQDLINSNIWSKDLFPEDTISRVRSEASAAGNGNIARALFYKPSTTASKSKENLKRPAFSTKSFPPRKRPYFANRTPQSSSFSSNFKKFNSTQSHSQNSRYHSSSARPFRSNFSKGTSSSDKFKQSFGKETPPK